MTLVPVESKIENNKCVNLLFASPLYYINSAIRYSHATWDKSDTNFASLLNIGENDLSLIERVGFHFNHSSVLEHSLLIFDVRMTTKALLEESRHRIGVSQTVTSSRYALKKITLEYESTGDFDIDSDIEYILNRVKDHLNDDKPMDKVAMLLPQAFIYRLQLSFNLRSLVHFLQLRLAKGAHYTIRKIAYHMVEEIKEKQPEYFKLLMSDSTILDLYEKNKDRWYKDFKNATINETI